MKNKNSIFGIPYEEFKRQCNVAKNEGDLTQKPIVEGEILEPCLRGAEKILENSETLRRARNVLTESNYNLNVNYCVSQNNIGIIRKVKTYEKK